MALTNTHIIVACKNNQLYKIRYQHDKPDEMGKISYLTQPSQQGSITAIATCLKMQIVFTASSDKTIALWKYSINNFLELDFIQNMNDDILAMDAHPSGFYLILSFNSHLRFCNIIGG
jgi:WD40 repeat protein